jgi:hypothetical protein
LIPDDDCRALGLSKGGACQSSQDPKGKQFSQEHHSGAFHLALAVSG